MGIVGAGRVGLVLARLATGAGHVVRIAGSGDPSRIADAVAASAPHAQAVWAPDVADADLTIAAVPITKARHLPHHALQGRVLVDAMNYWWETDGLVPELSDRTTSTSQTIARWLPGVRVVKAFNHASVWELEHLAMPPGDPQRRGIAVAGDHASDVALVCDLVDSLGFDPVVAGPLEAGVSFEPGTEAFGADATTAQLRQMLERFPTSQRGRVIARARDASHRP